MEECKKSEVVKIISEGCVKPVYQPIVSLKDGSVHGYEALSRITYKDASMNIAQLFEYAAQLGYLWDIEKICRTKALKNAICKPKGTKLFINVDGIVLRDRKFQTGFTKEKLDKYALKITDIVFELTERSDFDNHDLLREIMRHYTDQGYEVALDDLGAGYSGLNRLQAVKPNYVKIDYELVHDIHKDKSKKSLVRMLARHCSDMEYMLVAEGIETEEELKCLINLGVNYGQGYYLGRPKETFEKVDKAIVKQICDLQKKKTGQKNKVGSIGKMGTVLYPSCSIEHAYHVFSENEQLQYVGIVDCKCRFYGIINRETIMMQESDDTNMKRPVEEIMNTQILTIDADKSIKAAIGKLMYRDDKTFYDPIAILKKDRYYGIASVRELVIAIGKEL